MAYDGSLKFDTRIDTEGFKSGINNINNLLNQIKTSVQNITNAVANMASNINSVASEAGERLNNTNENLSETSRELENTSRYAENAAGNMQNVGSAADEASEQIESVSANAGRAAVQIDNLSNHSDETAENLDAIAQNAENTSEQLDNVSENARQTERHIENVGNSSETVSRELEQIGESGENAARGLGAVPESVTPRVGLDGENEFKKSINNINNSFEVLNSELRVVNSQFYGNENSVEALSEKNKILRREIENQTQKIQVLRQALENASSSFGENDSRTQSWRVQLNNATVSLHNMERDLTRNNYALEEASRNLDDVTDNTEDVGNQSEKASKNIDDLGNKSEKTKDKMSGLKTVAGKLGGVLKSVAELTATAVTAVSGGLLAVGTAAVKQGTEFESAFAGVVKTVDATDEQLSNLRQGLLDMSKEIPQRVSDLSAIAEAAGQLGIKTDNIKEFTEVMANLGVATNMTSDEAATSLARFANITGMPQGDFDRLGSTVVALGNNLATTESEIVDMSMRIAGAGKQVGMSESQIMSFAGALSSVGIESEMGGTAFSNLLSKMQLAIDKGGESLDKFAKVAGISGDEFKKLFKKDATEAVSVFLKELNKINETGGSAINTLDDMGLSDARMRDTLLRASSASDIFTKAMSIGTEAWKDNTALTNEAGKRYETLESKIQLMKNGVQNLGIAFKDSINDKLREAVQTGTEYVDRLSKAFTDGGLGGAVEEAGKIFGDLTIKIAEYAPGMIDASIEFIKAFAKGFIDNKDTVINAAKEILSTLKNTLIELLPQSIQNPVRDITEKTETTLGNIAGTLKNVFTDSEIKKAVEFAVDIIGTFVDVLTDIINSILPAVEDGFKNIQKALGSTGFKNAIKSVKDAFKLLGDIIKNIAKTYIPLFTNAVGFILENLDILIPLLATTVGGFAAFKIVQNVVKWSETFAGTLKKLIGNITNFITQLRAARTATQAADGAQKAFNTTLLANPVIMITTVIGTLVAGLAVLVTYLVTSTGHTRELWDATNELSEQQEKTKESAEKLGEGLGKAGDYAKDFRNDIDKAKSSLDGVSDSAIIDTDKMSKLSESLEDTQKEFNEIAGRYSDGRKEMTDGEIKELEKLFEKMRSLSEQELELTKQYQTAAKTGAETWVTMSAPRDADEYAEESKSYIKAAEETRDKVISAAESNYQAQIVSINKMTGLSAKEREKKLKLAQSDRDKAVGNAKKEYSDTMAVISKGYQGRTNINDKFLGDTTKFYTGWKDAVKEFVSEKRTIDKAYSYNENTHRTKITEANTRFNNNLQQLYDDFAENFDDTKAKYLGTWLEMVKSTVENGGKIDDETAAMVEFYLLALDRLPPESKDKMQTTVDGLKEVADKLPPEMKKRAEKAANEYADGVGDTSAQSKSESNAKKLSEGAGNQLKDADFYPIGKNNTLDFALGMTDENPLRAVAEAAAEVRRQAEEELEKETSDFIGKNFALGFAVGIADSIPGVNGVARNMIKEALRASKYEADEHSPSRKTRKIGRFFTEGLALGITDEQNKVIKSATEVTGSAVEVLSKNAGAKMLSARVALEADTGEFIGRLKDKIANADLTARLKAAVVAGAGSISGSIAGRNMNNYIPTEKRDGGTLRASGNIETHISIDGREFAVATVPYIDEELAFVKG